MVNAYTYTIVDKYRPIYTMYGKSVIVHMVRYILENGLNSVHFNVHMHCTKWVLVILRVNKKFTDLQLICFQMKQWNYSLPIGQLVISNNGHCSLLAMWLAGYTYSIHKWINIIIRIMKSFLKQFLENWYLWKVNDKAYQPICEL